MTLRTVDWEELNCYVDVPKDYPKNALTRVELEEKFRNLTSLVLPREQGMEIVQILNKIEKLDEIVL